MLSIVPGCIIGGAVAYLVAWAIMPESTVTTEGQPGRRRLTRSTANRKLAGVCGGLADYLAIDATAVRLLWIVLTIVPGAIVLGIVAYIVAWFIMPGHEAAGGVVAPTAA